GARGLQERAFARTDFSPRLWPRATSYLVRIEDAAAELDLSFPVDRELVSLGFRSILRLPLVQGDLALGSLVLVSRRKAAFSEEHGRRLAVVADLVTLALAHERLAGAWRERRRRRDALERLVPALTGTLDVRAVFEQISRNAQELIPHDYLSLGLRTEDRKRVRMIASFGTGRDTVEMPEYVPCQEELDAIHWDYFLARDHTVLGNNVVRAHLLHHDPSRPATLDMKLDDDWLRGYTDLGVRSTIRAPIRVEGVVVGGLGFNARR